MQQSTIDIVNDMALEFGVSPELIVGQIQFESEWNPKAKNPNSSARGLIQFLDSTAREMGYSSSLDLVNTFPDIDSQLNGPVREYWRKYAPYSNDNEFILAVFRPADRRKSLDTALSETVKAANPGLETLGDYVSM